MVNAMPVVCQVCGARLSEGYENCSMPAPTRTFEDGDAKWVHEGPVGMCPGMQAFYGDSEADVFLGIDPVGYDSPSDADMESLDAAVVEYQSQVEQDMEALYNEEPPVFPDLGVEA